MIDTRNKNCPHLIIRMKPIRGGKIVFWMEFGGYLLLLSVLVFFTYSWFRRVPIISGAQGTASPTTVDIAVKKETAVLKCFVEHGQHVKKGQALLEVTDDPVEVSLLHAREALRTRPAANSDSAKEAEYKKWAAILSSPDLDVGKGRIIASPIDGWVIFTGGASMKEAFSAENKEKKLFGKPPAHFADKGALLFFLADFRSLRVYVKVKREQWAAKIALGQPTKVWFKDKLSNLSEDAMPGKLISWISAEDAGREGADIPGGKIVIAEGSIAGLPMKARDKARRDFFARKMESWQPAIAITVDSMRLLSQLRTPKP